MDLSVHALLLPQYTYNGLHVIVTVTGYTISYINTDNTECFTDSNTVTNIDGSANGYTIGGLEEGTQYTITVAIEGRADEDTVVQATQDDGIIH